MSGVTGDPQALGAYLQARRAARRPEAAGLPGSARRRTPGLRREELAAVAGVSVDYLTRLEQGRHREPSAEVLAALASALGLNADGRAYLFLLAGRRDPGLRTAVLADVSQTLRQLVHRMSPCPAWLLNRRRDILVWNDAASALLGDLGSLADHDRNQLVMTFGSPAARLLWPDWALVAEDSVAQFRQILDGRATSEDVDALLARLLDESPEFADLWSRQDVARICHPVRRVQHPGAGELVFDIELLDAAGGDLQVVVLEPLDPVSREQWLSWMRSRWPEITRLRAL